jgi:pimeloyl-ACP methyl ester carboxylesterase
MPKVIIDNESYHYAAAAPESDRKNALLFVHGSGGSQAIWANQLAGLGQNFLTLAVDLPGHGDSEGASSREVQKYSDFIFDFIERALGAKVILAGHSLGGAIAIDFALRFPDKLSGLILVCTGARLRVAPFILEHYKAGKSFPESVNFAYSDFANPDLKKQAILEMENTDPSVYYNDFLACDNFNCLDRIGSITAPTLVISATNDLLTPPKYSQYLADNIPNAQLRIIEQSGHMVMREQPDQVNALIKEFVMSL